MGVIGVESEVGHSSVENGSEVNKINGLSEPIKFGSHASDEPIKEPNNSSESNFPKDAVDEWPEPKQVHSFYFVKYRSYDDQKLKAKLDQADKDLQRLNQARSQITEKLRAKRAVRGQVMTQIRSLSGETKQYNMLMDEKRKEMEPLTQALGTLRGPNNTFRDRGFVCSSEEELNHLIKSLQYRIQHESIPLTEEKQILREIKQLEGTREQVLAKAAVRAKIQDSLGEKETIQDQVKLIGGDLDGVRKERQAVRDKLKQHDSEKEAIEKEIDSLQDELTIVTEKRDKAYEKIQELRKQREEGNTPFYQNRTLLIKGRELAAKKDVEALRELSDVEAGKFIALCKSSKAIRDDYEKRILPSLDIRQLSKDGRMRNPGEKPLVAQEVQAPPVPEPEVLAKPKARQVKEELVPPPQDNTGTTQKEKSSKPEKETKAAESEDTEEVFGLERVEKVPPKRTEVDEKKLKELKREEEAAKAKQALERKKKLAEKAAAKAAIKAQKEAEKKIKEREKKAKKKQQASAPEQEEATEVVSEPEKAADVTVEAAAAPVPSKTKERKENTIIRQRGGRAKGSESISKVILKRKKSTNYWVWAAAPVAACVLVLLVIGYNSFL